MVRLAEKRLEVKSHSDEVLKEVKEYFQKNPGLPAKSAISPVEKELEKRIKYLEKFVKDNK